MCVWLSDRPTAAAACGGFAAERPRSRRYRSIAVGAPCSKHRRLAVTNNGAASANAGSVMLTADVGS